MRKILSIVAIVALVFSNAVSGFSAPSGVAHVLVTIDKTVSISISGSPVDFGRMGVGVTAVSSSAIVITNDGSGADETLTLSVTDPAGWTHGVPAENVYRMRFQFSVDGTGETWQSASAVSQLIAYDESKSLWIKLETPTATNVTTQQTTQVTITAE
ncbi:MAG: hypothetical protein ISS92_04075 [Candidatus Omnitrophica bacterium]|nr:hypothetical protein [Candidatus Omnitrophota bacterium]